MKLVKMWIMNDHFHDNVVVFAYDGKIFSCITALAEYLGGDYMDLDSILWHSIKFVFNNREISYDEVLDY